MLLSLASLLIVSTLVISPVSAKKVVYRANGTLDQYNDPMYDGAIVFQGSWNIKIKENNEVDFEVRFLEKNINEEIPGTFDKFKIVLTQLDSLDITDSVCVIEGTLVWHKTGWDLEAPDGYIGDPPGNIYFREFSMVVRITIDPSDLLIVWDIDNNIGFEGSTLSIHY